MLLRAKQCKTDLRPLGHGLECSLNVSRGRAIDADCKKRLGLARLDRIHDRIQRIHAVYCNSFRARIGEIREIIQEMRQSSVCMLANRNHRHGYEQRVHVDEHLL